LGKAGEVTIKRTGDRVGETIISRTALTPGGGLVVGGHSRRGWEGWRGSKKKKTQEE